MMMADPEEEEFDFENDESWYEDAMNALDSPTLNHGNVYMEDEIKDLSEMDKTLIRYRNYLLKNEFEYVELQFGDYMQDVIGRSATIHYLASNFVITYQRGNSYVALFQLKSEDEVNTNPIQIASLIHLGKHLGSYQFLYFFHLEQELEPEQKNLNGIKINR